MASYKFRLEKVLNYKETVEGFKKAEYGQVHQRLNQEEDKLLNFNSHKENLIKKKDKSIKNTNIGSLVLFNNYIKDISKNIEDQERIVDETKEELQKAQEELIVAMQEKKTFVKLKEKDYEEYLDEEKRQEEKIIDEIVTFKNNTQ